MALKRKAFGFNCWKGLGAWIGLFGFPFPGRKKIPPQIGGIFSELFAFSNKIFRKEHKDLKGSPSRFKVGWGGPNQRFFNLGWFTNLGLEGFKTKFGVVKHFLVKLLVAKIPLWFKEACLISLGY